MTIQVLLVIIMIIAAYVYRHDDYNQYCPKTLKAVESRVKAESFKLSCYYQD